MSSASPAANVLPQKASVTVNFRIMPGETIEDVRRHIEKYMGGENVEIEFIKGKEPSIVSPTDTRAFKTLSTLSVSLDEKISSRLISLWAVQTHITMKTFVKIFTVLLRLRSIQNSCLPHIQQTSVFLLSSLLRAWHFSSDI